MFNITSGAVINYVTQLGEGLAFALPPGKRLRAVGFPSFWFTRAFIMEHYKSARMLWMTRWKPCTHLVWSKTTKWSTTTVQQPRYKVTTHANHPFAGQNTQQERDSNLGLGQVSKQWSILLTTEITQPPPQDWTKWTVIQMLFYTEDFVWSSEHNFGRHSL